MLEYFKNYKYVYFTKDILNELATRTEHLKEKVEDRFDCYLPVEEANR